MFQKIFEAGVVNKMVVKNRLVLPPITTNFATENGVRVADEAIKLFGAYGISGEYPVERYYREAKIYQIVEGAANIQKMIIGTDALGYRKANG